MSSRKSWGAFFSTVLALAEISAIALGQEDYSVNNHVFSDAEASSPSDAGLAFASSDCTYSECGGCGTEGCYRRCCCPQWTVMADFIVFDRIGAKTQTLVQREILRTEEEALNSNDFNQGFRGGPRVGLIRHGCGCYDLEILYFQIDGWHSSRTVTPDTEQQERIDFICNNYPVSSYEESMQFDYGSKLYNAEFNVRWNPLCRLTMMAGFRWVELQEYLHGGFVASTIEPFWTTDVKNNLYGFQIGADGILWQGCRLSINGLLKAGIYGNHAEQTSWLNSYEYEYLGTGADSTNHTAFLGEIGLQARYQVTDCLALRAGYEVLWIDGVALAPAQIPVTYFDTVPTGINAKGTAFYHGASAGLEYKF